MINFEDIKSQLPVEAENIELRLFTESDISERYVGWLNDQMVVKYSNQRFYKHTKETCVDYCRSFNGSNSFFIAILAENKKMIGTMSVYFKVEHDSADIGIMLGDRESWGKGIGKTAWRIMLDFLSNVAGVRKITGGTLSCNDSMLKIMKSSGMEEDGIRKCHEVVDGLSYDMLHFAKFRKI